MIENRTRLRVVIVCVVGLALFHLLLGRYEFYPFIHWTMFSQQEHIPTKTSFKHTVLLAIDARQEPHKIYLNHLFTTFPGGGGPGQAVTTYYLRRLRQGDQAAANEVAALIEANTDFGPVVGLQLETHTWFLDSIMLESDEISLNSERLEPDQIEVIIRLTVDAAEHDDGLQ